MINIKVFDSQQESIWNRFIEEHEHHFFFNRNFLNYHGNRFKDFSLMFEVNGTIRALFPSTLTDTSLTSHAGLTFGGILFERSAKSEMVHEIVNSLVEYAKHKGITSITFKFPPGIYNYPQVDVLKQRLFQLNSEWCRCEITYAIDLTSPRKYGSRKKRNLAKAKRFDLIVERQSDFDAFWEQVLIPNLQSRHKVAPVHTSSEISYLHSQFNTEIRQYNVTHEGKIIAGTTLFLTGNVIHAQYISANEKGKEMGALDFLFDQIIVEFSASNFRFLNLGTVNENQGKITNMGLAMWKEEFGAKGYLQESIRTRLTDFM